MSTFDREEERNLNKPIHGKEPFPAGTSVSKKESHQISGDGGKEIHREEFKFDTLGEKSPVWSQTSNQGQGLMREEKGFQASHPYSTTTTQTVHSDIAGANLGGMREEKGFEPSQPQSSTFHSDLGGAHLGRGLKEDKSFQPSHVTSSSAVHPTTHTIPVTAYPTTTGVSTTTHHTASSSVKPPGDWSDTATKVGSDQREHLGEASDYSSPRVETTKQYKEEPIRHEELKGHEHVSTSDKIKAKAHQAKEKLKEVFTGSTQT
jgi:hypothetical protein